MASRESAPISALKSANKGHGTYCSNCEQQEHEENECSLPPLEMPPSKEEHDADWKETTGTSKTASGDSTKTSSKLIATSFERFSDLPVELKLKIWTFAALDHGRKLTYRLHNDIWNPIERIPNPLLRACKQSRSETLRILTMRNVLKHSIFVHIPAGFKNNLHTLLSPGALHSRVWNRACRGCGECSQAERFGRVQIKVIKEGKTITENILVLIRHRTGCLYFRDMESDLKTLVAGHLSCFYGSKEGERWTILKRSGWMRRNQPGARRWSNLGNYGTWLP